MTTPAETDVHDAAIRAQAGEVLLLDVREPEEWAQGHAPTAEHLPMGQVQLDALATDRPILAICRSGNRSGKVAAALAAAGVDVTNVAGGMKAWESAGLPVVTGDGQPGTVA